MSDPDVRKLLLFAHCWVEHLDGGPPTSIDPTAAVADALGLHASLDGGLPRGMRPDEYDVLVVCLVLARIREIAINSTDDAPLESFLLLTRLARALDRRAIAVLLEVLGDVELQTLLEAFIQGIVTPAAVEARCTAAGWLDSRLAGMISPPEP